MRRLIIMVLFIEILLSCDKENSVIIHVADFKIDSITKFINDTVQFINMSKGIDNTMDSSCFQWFFEGGIPNHSNLLSPKVSYPQPGSFMVKLIVKNKYGIDSIIKSDIVQIHGIYAGGLEGINVIRKDYPESKTYFDSIDLNEDGIYDINFIHIVSCCRIRDDQIYVKPLNKTQISIAENHPFYVKKHAKGDIISPGIVWCDFNSTLCLSGVYSHQAGGSYSSGSCGLFDEYNHDGYICFQINKQIYGWINLSSYASFWGGYLYLKEYAYSN